MFDRSGLPVMAKSGFKTALLGLCVLVGSGAAAMADPFTFNPSASAPALSSAGPFTADNIIFSQYSDINIAANGTFNESGILRVANFQSNGAALLPPGFAGTAGATPYSLYFTFSGTGTINGVAAGSTGTFTSLTANIFGDVGNDNGSINVTGGAGGVPRSPATPATTCSLRPAPCPPAPSH